MRAIEEAAGAVGLDRLVSLLAESMDVDGLVGGLPRLGTTLERLLPEIIKATADDGGFAAVEPLARSLGVDMRFDALNPRAVEWARAHAGELVSHIDDEQMQTVRNLIVKGYEEGRAPRVIAREIREHVGLLPQHSEAIRKNAARMAARGATEDEIAKMVELRTRKLLRFRSEMIARHETITSAYQGAREGWRQAREAGLIGDMAVQRWIIGGGERTCVICRPLSGRTAPLDGEFAPGIKQPGDPHPQCRCGIVLLPNGAPSPDALAPGR